MSRQYSSRTLSVALAAGLGVAATAALPSSGHADDGMIYACVNPGEIVTRLQAGAPLTCLPNERLLSWNAMGLPGADGADGEDGEDGQDGVDGTDGADGVTKVYFTRSESNENVSIGTIGFTLLGALTPDLGKYLVTGKVELENTGSSSSRIECILFYLIPGLPPEFIDNSRVDISGGNLGTIAVHGVFQQLANLNVEFLCSSNGGVVNASNIKLSATLADEIVIQDP